MIGLRVAGAISVLLIILVAPTLARSAEVPTYSGAVRPLHETVLLRYGPVASMRTHWVTHMEIGGNDPRSFRMTMTTEGPVVLVGERLEWRQKMWMALNKAKPETSGPSLNYLLVTDRRGQWSSAELSGHHPTKGTGLQKGTAGYEELVNELTSGIILLPSEAVSQGGDLFSSMSEADKVRFLGSSFPNSSDADIDIEQIVRGDTMIAGRRGIVTQIDGKVS